MPPLLDVQRDFRRALLDRDLAALSGLIATDGIAIAERIEIYRNNVVASLSEALADTFPVVVRLVGAPFFSFAAHEFIRAAPPQAPCVSEYGAYFADFLAEFPPCAELVYLTDVARLEWLLHGAAGAPDAASFDPAGLADFSAETADRLMFGFRPSIAYLRSQWPIARIWRANQPDADEELAIDLDAGGVLLEISRRDGIVEFRELSPPAFAFRAALAGGAAFVEAIEMAGQDASFDAAAEFAALFVEGIVMELKLTGSD
jgi:hypothetical protein